MSGVFFKVQSSKSNFLKSILASAVLLALTACQQPKGNSESPFLATGATGIIGGVAVENADPISRSTVALYDVDSGPICTASLITKNIAVTAAHCVEGFSNNLFLVFGARLPTQESEAVYRKVLTVKIHETYGQIRPDAADQGDIALIKFEGKSLPEGFKPATLLASSSHLVNGGEAILAGYGLTSMLPRQETDRLLKTTVKIANAKYGKTEVSFSQANGNGACHGDSGGPAFVRIKDSLVLFGVTSRSLTLRGGSTCLEGSIYSSIPGHIKWIRANVKLLNAPATQQRLAAQ